MDCDDHRRRNNEEKEIVTADLDLQIPDDVTAEILSRLPIKSIGRFVSVSKNWRDIIKSRSFSSVHAKNKPLSTFFAASRFYDLSPSFYDRRHDNSHVVEVSESGEYVTTTIHRRVPELSEKSWKKMRLVGSCNGLLCLLAERRVGSFEAGIFIFNPITNETTLIALPNQDEDDGIVELNKGENHIFGYSPSTDEYKILSIKHGAENPYAICTVGVGERWRKLPPHLFPHFVITDKAVHCNGAFHWLVDDGNNKHDRHYYILAFDIAEEKTRRMSIIPPPQRDERHLLRLLLLNNRLSLSTGSAYGRRNTLIRKMEDYGDADSWSQIVAPEIMFFVPRPAAPFYLWRPKSCSKRFSALRDYVVEDYFAPLDCATKHGGILFRGTRPDHLELYCPRKKTRATIQVPYNAELFIEFNPNFSSIDEILYGGKNRARAATLMLM